MVCISQIQYVINAVSFLHTLSHPWCVPRQDGWACVSHVILEQCQTGSAIVESCVAELQSSMTPINMKGGHACKYLCFHAHERTIADSYCLCFSWAFTSCLELQEEQIRSLSDVPHTGVLYSHKGPSRCYAKTQKTTCWRCYSLFQCLIQAKSDHGQTMVPLNKTQKTVFYHSRPWTTMVTHGLPC